jgi:hypothetical protein
VRPTAYPQIDNLSNVNIATVTGGDLLVYDGTDARWENAAQSTITAGKATNIAGGAAGSLPYQSATDTTTFLAAGSDGQVLKLASGVPTWSSDASGVTITDDTTTNATRYVTFTDATTGTETGLDVSSTKLTFNPSTGVVGATGLNLSGLTASYAVATDGSKNLVSVANTGTGDNVLATSPTLTTPTIGVATATSINKVAITAPATSATLTIADGKTLTASNSITLAGTDATTMTFPPASASIGYLDIPQNSQSAAYTLVLADSGKHIFHPSADTTARTFTIPADSSVAFPVGTAITFVNQNGAGVVTIAITTDTMRLAGAGTTGSRTLAANGVATAIKIASTEWIISGVGLT